MARPRSRSRSHEPSPSPTIAVRDEPRTNTPNGGWTGTFAQSESPVSRREKRGHGLFVNHGMHEHGQSLTGRKRSLEPPILGYDHCGSHDTWLRSTPINDAVMSKPPVNDTPRKSKAPKLSSNYPCKRQLTTSKRATGSRHVCGATFSDLASLHAHERQVHSKARLNASPDPPLVPKIKSGRDSLKSADSHKDTTRHSAKDHINAGTRSADSTNVMKPNINTENAQSLLRGRKKVVSSNDLDVAKGMSLLTLDTSTRTVTAHGSKDGLAGSPALCMTSQASDSENFEDARADEHVLSLTDEQVPICSDQTQKPSVVSMLVNEACRHFNQRIRHIEAALQDAEQNSSSPGSTATQTPRTNTPSSSKRSYRSNFGDNGRMSSGLGQGGDGGNNNDDDDHDDEYPQRGSQAQNSSPGPALDKRLFFACPFYKNNPEKHERCKDVKQRLSRRMKDHVYKKHAPPPHYCIRCKGIFKTAGALQNHADQFQACLPGQFLRDFDGITKEQLKDLQKKKLPSGDKEKWDHMYLIIFPSTDEADMPCPYHNLDGEKYGHVKYFHDHLLSAIHEEVTIKMKPRFDSLAQRLRDSPVVQNFPAAFEELIQEVEHSPGDIEAFIANMIHDTFERHSLLSPEPKATQDPKIKQRLRLEVPLSPGGRQYAQSEGSSAHPHTWTSGQGNPTTPTNKKRRVSSARENQGPYLDVTTPNSPSYQTSEGTGEVSFGMTSLVSSQEHQYSEAMESSSPFVQTPSIAVHKPEDGEPHFNWYDGGVTQTNEMHCQQAMQEGLETASIHSAPAAIPSPSHWDPPLPNFQPMDTSTVDFGVLGDSHGPHSETYPPADFSKQSSSTTQHTYPPLPTAISGAAEQAQTPWNPENTRGGFDQHNFAQLLTNYNLDPGLGSGQN